MGGCATKPKDDREADHLGKSVAPVESNESADTIREVLEAEKQISEIGVVEEALDDHGNRRRSLSLLFKENEEQKGSTEDEQLLLTVPEKQEELSKAETEADKKFEAKLLLEDEETGVLVESIGTENADNALKTDKVGDVHCAATLAEKDETSEEKETVKEESKNETIETKEIARQAELAPAQDVVNAPKQSETTEEKETEREAEGKDEIVEKKEIVKEEDRNDEIMEKKETAKQEDREDESIEKKEAEEKTIRIGLVQPNQI